MKIGIITAMPEETQAIVRALQHCTENSERVDVRCTRLSTSVMRSSLSEAGMGFANATAAARQLMGELRPDLVVSAGFCGGISAELQVGDVVRGHGADDCF